MDRTEFLEIINRLSIPRTIVAALAGCYPQDISQFTSGLPLTEKKVESITQVTRELAAFIESQKYPPSMDIKHIDLLRETLGAYRIAIIQQHGSDAKYVWAEEKPTALSS